MAISKFAGKAQTVLGLMDGTELGVTLPHEHLIMEHVTANFNEPTNADGKAMAQKPVSLEILHWLQYHRAGNRDNMNLLDEPEAIAEAYWQIHLQHPSAWSFEIDLRPYKETF